MSERHDTIDGLLAEFRGYAAGMPASYHVTMSWADFRKMLDRFEAAHKRELSKNVSKNGADFGQLGDAAKLREALEALLNLAYEVEDMNSDSGPRTSMPTKFVIDTAKSAISAPPRNCDVGTAEEQGERFSAYCRAHKHPESECLLCPLFGQTGGYCELAWAQLPYVEKEGGKK